MPRNSANLFPIPYPSLLGNFAWTLTGNAVYGACQWAILIVFSKFGSPEIVGEFVLGLAICTPLMMLAHLELRSVEATDARHQYNLEDYLALVLLTSLISLVFIAGIVWLAGYGLRLGAIILLIGAFKLFENVSFVFYGFFQKTERMSFFSTSLILKGVLSVLLVAISMYSNGSLLWSVVFLAGVWGAVLIAYDIRGARKIVAGDNPGTGSNPEIRSIRSDGIRPNWDVPVLKDIFTLCAPLGMASAIASLDVNIPRYLMERHLNLSALGIFSAMAYMVVIGGRFVVTLMHAFMPRLARYYLEKRKSAFIKLLGKQVFVILLLAWIPTKA